MLDNPIFYTFKSALLLGALLLLAGTAFSQTGETAKILPEPRTEVSLKADDFKILPEIRTEDFRTRRPFEKPGAANPFAGFDKKTAEKNRKTAESFKPAAEKLDFRRFAPEESSQSEVREKFHWKPAIRQSLIFLTIQHSYRMTQEKTRRELGGAFFRDWAKSVKGLRGWRDPDSFFINYVLHPLQGGLTGRIFVVNSDRANRQEFGKSKQYWETRFKAFVWSTVWSTQFEFGPLSEASLGNVGIREKNGRSTMAYVDLVITPTLGTGVLVAEDAIDKYVLKNWLEKKFRRTSVIIKILRCLFTPTTAFSNVLRGKAPWQRDFR
jgi:hypothetical protein